MKLKRLALLISGLAVLGSSGLFAMDWEGMAKRNEERKRGGEFGSKLFVMMYDLENPENIEQWKSLRKEISEYVKNLQRLYEQALEQGKNSLHKEFAELKMKKKSEKKRRKALAAKSLPKELLAILEQFKEDAKNATDGKELSKGSIGPIRAIDSGWRFGGGWTQEQAEVASEKLDEILHNAFDRLGVEWRFEN